MPREDDVVAGIRRWLRDQGYPLEMQTARIFQSAGLEIAQGFYYNDPDTGTPREMDVLASRGHQIAGLDVRVTCLAECKMTQDKPWVAFARPSPDSFQRISYYSRVASKPGMRLLSQLHRTAESRDLPQILRTPSNLAYGVTQTHRNHDRDPAFVAITAAAKSAIARARVLESDDPRDLPNLEIILPMVVLQGRLFECTLDPDGSERLVELGRSLLDLRMPIPGRSLATLLHVVTLEELPRVAEQVMELFRFLEEECAEDIEEMSRELRQDRERLLREGRGGS